MSREFVQLGGATPKPKPSPDGQTWWRSLEEMADTQEFRDYLYREFPENASTWLGGSRRDFLRLMGASLALAGLTGCDIRQPQEKIVPVVKQAGHLPPGTSQFFTTAMEVAGQALGLVVKSDAGRPIKVEGNREHPTSRGATHIFAQAATLDLYDPDRLSTTTRRGAIVPPRELLTELTNLTQRFGKTDGEALRFLMRPTTSPTSHQLLGELTQRWPKAQVHFYDPVATGNTASGMWMAFGAEATGFQPVYHFDKASVVLSIDCDFLAANGRPIHEVADFMSVRRVAGREGAANDKPSMVKLFHVGSTPTLTSAKADEKLLVGPADVEAVLSEVARRLEVPGVGGSDAPKVLTTFATKTADWITAVVAILKQGSGSQSAVIAVGDAQPARVHALAHAINAAIGADKQCVEFRGVPTMSRPDRANSELAGTSALSSSSSNPQDVNSAKPVRDVPAQASASVRPTDGLATLVTDMNNGNVSTLFILGGNPVFDAPSDLNFAATLKKVRTTYALSRLPSETTELCEWVIPESHFLEAWGDVTAQDGTASIVQPLIEPLHDTLTTIELLAGLLNPEIISSRDSLPAARRGYEAVRETWRSRLQADDFEKSWTDALRRGVIEEKPVAKLVKSFGLGSDLPKVLTTSATTDSDWTVLFRPDPTIHDGQYANNGWLQELPKPLSKLTWDNVAWINRTDAQNQGLSNGDCIRLSNGKHEVVVPVWIMPGQAAKCVTLFFGYGRRVGGRVATGTGVDVFPLRTSDAMWEVSGVKLTNANEQRQLATTQHHHLMEGRHLARTGTLLQLLDNPEHPEFVHPPEPEVDSSFYEPWDYSKGHRWGMTIDLTACTGCMACTIACQAENNIPVVGKDEVARNREMHWIRVDTWYEGSADEPEQTLHQPVPCMHCEQAPCEVVCPVAATNHSEEGLNQMVYNRCVGTRYCSNNCPYKVRRFNFLDFSDNFLTAPGLELLSNPNVSVRERGVMEKCTYCVQRIESARIDAHRNDREIQEGDVVTACQSACPAQAIRFGDLNDPKSAVRETHDHPLNYGLLENLNTRPRTTYLAEVRNK